MHKHHFPRACLRRSVLPAVLLLGAAACAQEAPFEGLSAGLNLALRNDGTELDTGGNHVRGLGWIDQGGSLQAAFGWPLGPTGVLSLGATYNLSDVWGASSNGPLGNTSLQRRNAYSIYLEPGYKFSDRTLGYARVGYESATMRADFGGSGADTRVEGTGYGLGLRTLMDRNMYLQAEVRQIFYNDATFAGQPKNFKTTSTEGLLGLGYQF